MGERKTSVKKPIQVLPQAKSFRHAPVWIEIDRAHLLNNVKKIRQWVGRDVGTIAVVKANAYGHGLEIVASTLAPHVSMFGVTRLQEVLRLRENDIETPTLVLGPTAPEEVPSAVQAQGTLTVSSLSEARAIDEVGARIGRVVPAHIKVDTGMGRLGIPLSEAEFVMEELLKLRQLRITGCYTHFPASDERRRNHFTKLQINRFHRVFNLLKFYGVNRAWAHLSNSGGVVSFKSAGGTHIRPGIMFYGILPAGLDKRAAQMGLKAVMAWRTRIAFVKKLAKGETCGYGCRFKAPRRLRVAWIPVGYSHGYPLSLSERGKVLIKGKRYSIAGRISMDFTAVNIGGNEDLRPGDTVTLIGRDGGDEILVSDLARWAGTISYEITTRIHPSIPRWPSP